MSTTGIINNLSQQEISDRYPTLITPGPATFGIRRLFYTQLIVVVVAIIVMSSDTYYGQAIKGISPLFWLSSALNIGRIVVFSYLQLGLSTVLILGFALVPALINQRLRGIQTDGQWLLPLPVGFYGGWRLKRQVDSPDSRSSTAKGCAVGSREVIKTVDTNVFIG